MFRFSLFLVFMVSWFLRLPTRFPPLGIIRFDLLLVLALVAATFVPDDSTERPSPTPVTTALYVLLAYMVLSLPFVAFPGSAVKFGFEGFIKAAIFYFFTRALVTTPQRLKTLIVVFLGCQIVRVLEPLYLHLTQGYWGSKAYMAGEYMSRLAGAPVDTINPNGLAYVIVTILPWLHFFAPIVRGGVAGYLALFPALMYALMLTASRSGLVALAAFAAAVIWQSKRRVLGLAAVAAVVFVVAPALSSDLRDRYLSIFSAETKNASTTELRVRGITLGLQVALKRPLFGYGVGTSQEANFNFGGGTQITHNLYVEVAQELGFVGLALFLWFLVQIVLSTTRTVRSLQDAEESSPVVVQAGKALRVWLIVNLVFSMASYGLSGFEWYFMAGLAEVLARLADRGDTASATGVSATPRFSDRRAFIS